MATKKKVPQYSIDILAIIHACKEAKVRQFKYKTLEILFDEPSPAIINTAISEKTPVTKVEEISTVPPSRDDELFNLMVADPLAFEEELSKDLEEA